ncbi:aldo/keto reductase [Penicillium malachiteum]|uniref:aldo/keto reductase n=1 Tax=Penicillium malachiteum TaxID=1324776 RepID=UPI0025479456|nr:aldo/keto reductase [Penicillium malachiteum]KAJ5721306.1 aldo/keto reductase [Penicillium malachiteum]
MPLLAGKLITQNGLGLMRLTWVAGPTPDEQAFKILKAALEAGANVWNGADFYGTPDNNSLHLMNRYFTAYPEDAEKVVLTIKSGIVDMRTFTMDCSPTAMRNFVDRANTILDGKKKIDIFGCGRVDKNVPIEETVDALAELVHEGKIGGIQLSEVSADTIRRAAKVTKIDMVEAEISLWSRDVFQNGVAETCAELGITMVAHTPLGAGMLTGHIKSVDDMPAGSYHKHFPRFQPENIDINFQLVARLKEMADAKGCTSAQLALSWIKTQSSRPNMPLFVPVAGARSEERVKENVKDVHFSEGDLQAIQLILDNFTVAGDRYPPAAAKLTEY